MKKMHAIFIITLLGGLSSCSFWQSKNTLSAQTAQPQDQVSTPVTPFIADSEVNSTLQTGTAGQMGGNLANEMDSADKNKLVRALDHAPGKVTKWLNLTTQIRYAVVPTQKLTINQNPYCRAYQVTAMQGKSIKNFNGVACVSDQGVWQSVN